MSTPHSVALGIHAVTKLMSPIQASCSRKASAASLNFGAMDNGRERLILPGVHSHRGLQRKKGIYFGLKIKASEKKQKSKSMVYAKCIRLNLALIGG